MEQNGKSRLSTETVLARVREDQALDLRIRGYTFAHIAEAIGYADSSGAHRAVSRGLERTNNGSLAKAEELKAMEVARLDRLLRALESGINSGDPSSINSAIRVSERLCKLMGLDAPVKAEVTGKDGRPIETVDLSALAKLSEEELALYERLCERMASTATSPA